MEPAIVAVAACFDRASDVYKVGTTAKCPLRPRPSWYLVRHPGVFSDRKLRLCETHAIAGRSVSVPASGWPRLVPDVDPLSCYVAHSLIRLLSKFGLNTAELSSTVSRCIGVLPLSWS